MLAPVTSTVRHSEIEILTMDEWAIPPLCDILGAFHLPRESMIPAYWHRQLCRTAPYPIASKTDPEPICHIQDQYLVDAFSVHEFPPKTAPQPERQSQVLKHRPSLAAEKDIDRKVCRGQICSDSFYMVQPGHHRVLDQVLTYFHLVIFCGILGRLPTLNTKQMA